LLQEKEKNKISDFCSALPSLLVAQQRRKTHVKERKQWKFWHGFGKIGYWMNLKILRNGKNRQFQVTPAHTGEHPAALCVLAGAVQIISP